MINTYYCSSEEFVKNSKIPVRVMKTEPDMMEEIAELMASTIEANNEKGEKTVIICPVGPIGQYPIFAKKVNDRNINLKNCWFINMDEYLVGDDETIPYENPLSFKATMDRVLYIATETVVNNGANKLRGALDIFPKRCITLGMKQLLKARVLKVYLYCNWQWGIMRKMALEEESRFMPVSFLQSHPNAEMVITESLYEFNL